MEENELQQYTSSLREKLNRALRRIAALKEKSKYLEMQYNDSRDREKNNNDLVMELIERQRELNVMLNRANIMLNRTQEAMALTSMEFNEMAKALPEPKKVEWADRVAKINDLFKKTGIQDAELVALENENARPGEPFSKEELKRESEQAFGRKESIWGRTQQREPPRVEAEIMDEEKPSDEHQPASFSIPSPPSGPADEAAAEDDDTDSESHRRSWWHRITSGN